MTAVYLIRIIRILSTILLLSYLLGCIWFVYVQIFYNYKDWLAVRYPGDDTTLGSSDNALFVDVYNLDIPKREDNVVKMIYFAFTTLSSVGFGDIRPYHTVERYFMIIIFLFTLTVFAAVLGNM
jgi:hypothetical protein